MLKLGAIVGGKRIAPSAAIALVLAAAPAPAWGRGQEAFASSTGAPDQKPYTISVNVQLVVLPVSVTDRRGDFVSGLKADNFQVYDSGRLQPITLFENGDVPVTVGLVVDNSGSMGPKRPGVVAASLAFVHSSNPGDQLFVVNFNERVTLGLPASMQFTSDADELREALWKQAPRGNTALYDGVAEGLEHLKSGIGQRKALIVVTDGGDNASHTTLPALIRMAEHSNAVIYTIGIIDHTYSDENPGVLKQLAKATGGLAYFPSSAAEVSNIAQQIAQDIRLQYTLGYVPPALPAAGDGVYRPVRVKVTAAREGKLRVRTRTGYVASSEASGASGPAR